jgi:transposase
MAMAVQDLSEAQLDGLIERIEEAMAHGLALSTEDLGLLLTALKSLAHLQERLADNSITLQKLRKLAGIVSSSEQFKRLRGAGGGKDPERKPRKSKPKAPPPAERVVQQRCHHKLEGLEKGQVCPECERGRLYKYEPASFLRISGQTPLVCTRHLLERLRCNTCGAYFEATVPEEVRQDGSRDQQYGYSARALMAIQKYFTGSPFYRQQTLQQLLGQPVSASTVFDQCEALANAVDPVHRCLKRLAGSAVHYHLDDTTNRILTERSRIKPNRRTGKPTERTGVYTSGLIATLADGRQVILYQTDIGHAGEWIDEILSGRPAQAPAPILMCDALSRNVPSVLDGYVLGLCNAHARREFVDLEAQFPDEIGWLLKQYAQIWVNEHHCQADHYDLERRLAYHREQSLPVMETLRDWMQGQLDTAAVEANSGLGKAMGYFLRHFEGLTAFCRVAGAQLDNNSMEQALKLIIRNRKNALFFKTQTGAAIADIIMSVLATCAQAQVNAFDYLVALQRHAQVVRERPEAWLPWNYQDQIDDLQKAA